MRGKQKFIVNGLASVQREIEKGTYGKDDDINLNDIRDEIESLFFEAEDYKEDEE